MCHGERVIYFLHQHSHLSFTHIMPEPKMKKPVARKSPLKSANAPEPTGPIAGPTCGHSSCGVACKVRYVGSTSHMRDHFVMHAARGVTHVWSAAVVTGLAVVLTGTVAFTAVQAKEGQRQALVRREMATRADLHMLNERLGVMERLLQQARQVCGNAVDSSSTPDAPNEAPKDEVKKPVKTER